MKKVNLQGNKYGRLSVLEETIERGSSGSVKWLCVCDCGVIKKITAHTLVSGESNSCGCNGIDRKDNQLGYEILNVVSCCKICNIAKNDMKICEFLSWIEVVFRKNCI